MLSLSYLLFKLYESGDVHVMILIFVSVFSCSFFQISGVTDEAFKAETAV